MAEINQVDVLVKVETPAVVDNQQLMVYIPVANYANGTAGVVKPNTDDFIVEADGTLKLNPNGTYLSGKVDTTNEENKLYGTDTNGNQALLDYSETNIALAVVKRDDKGAIHITTTSDADSAVNVKYLEDSLVDKLDKDTSVGLTRLYAIANNGTNYTIAFDDEPSVSSIAQRTSRGTVRTSNPTLEDDAVNLSRHTTDLQNLYDNVIGETGDVVAEAKSTAEKALIASKDALEAATEVEQTKDRLNNIEAKLNENIIKSPGKFYFVIYRNFESNRFGNYGFKPLAHTTIDWGDGTTEYFETAATEIITHEYTDGYSYHLITMDMPGIYKFKAGWFTSMGIREVYIPTDKIFTIGAYAFSGNGINVLNYGTIETIENYGFENCAIKNLVLKEGLVTLGTGAFDLASIVDVAIPSTVTKIGSKAFRCYDLKIVRMQGTTPPEIFGDTFWTNKLEKIIVPKSAINTYKTAKNWSALASKIVYEVDSSDIDVVKTTKYDSAQPSVTYDTGKGFYFGSSELWTNENGKNYTVTGTHYIPMLLGSGLNLDISGQYATIRTDTGVIRGQSVGSIEQQPSVYNGYPSDFSYLPRGVSSESDRVTPSTGDTVPGSTADGAFAISLGLLNEVHANYAMAFGYKNTVYQSAIESFIGGYGNEVYAAVALVNGSNNICGDSSNRSDGTMMAGSDNKNYGTGVIICGSKNTVYSGGYSSITGGTNNISAAPQCITAGEQNVNSSKAGLMVGVGLKGSNDVPGQVNLGQYNSPRGDSWLTFGAGTGNASSLRHNVMELRKTGNLKLPDARAIADEDVVTFRKIRTQRFYTSGMQLTDWQVNNYEWEYLQAFVVKDDLTDTGIYCELSNIVREVSSGDAYIYEYTNARYGKVLTVNLRTKKYTVTDIPTSAHTVSIDVTDESVGSITDIQAEALRNDDCIVYLTAVKPTTSVVCKLSKTYMSGAKEFISEIDADEYKYYVFWVDPTEKTYTLTSYKFQTLFGNKNILQLSSGNIDLYEHDIKITGTNIDIVVTNVISSIGTKVDSLTDMKLICGDTFVKACSGIANGKVAYKIDQTKIYLTDGTTQLLTGVTFDDDPHTV